MEKKYIPNIDATTGQRIDKTKPIYRLTATAYIADRLLDPEEMPIDPESEVDARYPLLITHIGIPSPHMEPANKLAEQMKSQHYPDGYSHEDPIEKACVI